MSNLQLANTKPRKSGIRQNYIYVIYTYISKSTMDPSWRRQRSGTDTLRSQTPTTISIKKEITTWSDISIQMRQMINRVSSPFPNKNPNITKMRNIYKGEKNQNPNKTNRKELSLIYTLCSASDRNTIHLFSESAALCISCHHVLSVLFPHLVLGGVRNLIVSVLEHDWKILHELTALGQFYFWISFSSHPCSLLPIFCSVL